MRFRKLILASSIAVAPVVLFAQGTPAPASQSAGTAQPSNAGQSQGGLDPSTIGKPLADSWPTYSGDYTGKRHSTLTQIDRSNVGNLGLTWVSRIVPGVPAAAPGRFGGFGGAPEVPTTVSYP